MSINKQFFKLSSLHLFFWTVFWLMVLVVIGTVAEKKIGLYQAQNTYFGAWIFWVGFVPLPAGIPTMGIIFLVNGFSSYWNSCSKRDRSLSGTEYLFFF